MPPDERPLLHGQSRHEVLRAAASDDALVSDVAHDALLGPYCEDYPCRSTDKCACFQMVQAALHRAADYAERQEGRS